MNSTPGSRSPARTAASERLARWAPGLATLLDYRASWLTSDLLAGLVLTAILVPVGMGYSEASGLPAIYGLYATIVPLIAYAVFGPSRIMVLGPDSTLAPVIAALTVCRWQRAASNTRSPWSACWPCCRERSRC